MEKEAKEDAAAESAFWGDQFVRLKKCYREGEHDDLPAGWNAVWQEDGRPVYVHDEGKFFTADELEPPQKKKKEVIDYECFLIVLEEQDGTLGLVVERYEKKYLMVRACMPGSPAELAVAQTGESLMPGDIIYTVNGTNTDLVDAVNMDRVVLEVMRYNRSPSEVSDLNKFADSDIASIDARSDTTTVFYIE